MTDTATTNTDQAPGEAQAQGLTPREELSIYLGLTHTRPREFARLLGVHESMVSRWLSGERPLSPVRFAQAKGMLRAKMVELSRRIGVEV